MIDIVKRRKIFGVIKQFKVDFAMLQETHAADEVLKLWQAEWGGQIYAANMNSTRGVMILIRKGLNAKILRVETDAQARIVIIEVEYNTVSYLLVNIYAPNQDDPRFFNKVARMISSFDNCNIIWGGDFNLVINPAMDRYNSVYNNSKACAALKEIIQQFDLVDVWRVSGPGTPGYTWSR